MKIEAYNWKDFAKCNDIQLVERKITYMYNPFNTLQPKFSFIALDSNGSERVFELLIEESVLSFYKELGIELSIPEDYKEKFIVHEDNFCAIVIWRA